MCFRHFQIGGIGAHQRIAHQIQVTGPGGHLRGLLHRLGADLHIADHGAALLRQPRHVDVRAERPSSVAAIATICDTVTTPVPRSR